MINSLTRPLFYDEHGRLQQVGEKVWEIFRKEYSYIGIRCPYERNGTVVPEISQNEFFGTSDVVAEYHEAEQSVPVISIHIKRPTSSAYKYWAANWDDIEFKNCAQNDAHFSRTTVSAEEVWITAEVDRASASEDGYVSILIPEVYSTVLSTPDSASQEAYNFDFKNGVWGSFHGDLDGTAHTALYTSQGRRIGGRWFYTVVQVKCLNADTGEYWYTTFSFPSQQSYSSTSITLEQIYNAFSNLGFSYDVTMFVSQSYKTPAMFVSVTRQMDTDTSIPRIYSGTAYAVDQLVDGGYYFVISYMDENGPQDIVIRPNEGSIVYFKQYSF